MHIVINELQALKQRTGIGHYTAELLRGLHQLAGPEHQIATFPGGWSRPVYRLCLANGVRGDAGSSGGLIAWRPAVLGKARRGVQAVLEHRFRAFCTRHVFDLYHEPNSVPFAVDCPTVATVHDLSPLLHPQWHPADRVDYFTCQLADALQRCAHIITDTDAVRQEVIQHLGIAPERVTRIHLGVREGLQPLPDQVVAEGLAKRHLPSRYLLYVGTLEPRKNVLMLLRAYCSLPADMRAAWPLLLVGGWGWNYGPIADYLRAVAQPRGVRHLGYLPDDDLPILYNGARALVYPSHYEGFGLPPLEMLACGGAVVASTADAVREVAAGHAQLLHPDDQDGWRRAMLRLVSDDDWWLTLRQGVTKAATGFTWERCAAATLQLYGRVSGQPQRLAA